MGIQINGNTDTVTSTSAGGSVKVTPLAASTGLNVGTGASISSPATNVLTLGTNNTEVIRVGAGGSVNIGATDTSYKLQVTGRAVNSNSYGILHIRDSQTLTGTAGTGGIFLSSSPGTDYYIAKGYTGSDTKLIFGNGNNGTEYVRIDSSGRMTIPSQPSFQTAGTNYTQTNAATVIIPNVVVFITGFTHSSGVFTVPVSGKYLFGFWGLSYPHGTEVNDVRAYKNGSVAGQLVQFNGTASNHEECSGTVLLDMSASDTFSWVYNRGSGSAAAYNSQWNMWGYLVG